MHAFAFPPVCFLKCYALAKNGRKWYIDMEKWRSDLYLYGKMRFFDFFKRKNGDAFDRADPKLFMRYREAVAACAEIEAHTGKSRTQLAGAYMKRMLRETDEWKAEHAEALFECFFIYDYLAQNGIIERKERACMLLHPEGVKEQGMCEIETFSSCDSCETGRIEIRPLYGDTGEKLLSGIGFQKENGRFILCVGDNDAPMQDYAVEAGCMLIDKNIGVCVYQKSLYDRIFARDFTDKRRYRVYAPENEWEIAFLYPWNPTLHRLLFLAGAKWNGKYMAMPLGLSDNALDLIDRYGFYVEPGAAKRMDAWQKAQKYARLMPKKHALSKEEKNLIDEFLSRPIEVLEDLVDE